MSSRKKSEEGREEKIKEKRGRGRRVKKGLFFTQFLI